MEHLVAITDFIFYIGYHRAFCHFLSCYINRYQWIDQFESNGNSILHKSEMQCKKELQEVGFKLGTSYISNDDLAGAATAGC